MSTPCRSVPPAAAAAAAACLLLMLPALAMAASGTDLKTVTVKQGGQVTARCGVGKVITAIVQPLYGAPLKKCNDTGSYKVVVARCLAKRSCTIGANNDVFGGDACPRIKKKLTFKYRCGAKASRPQANGSPSGNGNDDVQFSLLWGRSGENWSPTGRLADWSYAGYMGNEQPLPEYPNKFNVVEDFGAKGDGVADDTAAIQRAIKAASEAAYVLGTVDCGVKWDPSRRCLPPHNGFRNGGRAGVAVYLPAGKYKVTQTLEILESNVVLRGEGVFKTELFFPKSLSAIYGTKPTWATGGAFLTIDGNNAGSNQKQYDLAAVTADARKGSRRLQVSSTDGIQKGQWVRVYALATSPARRSLMGTVQQTASTPTNGTAPFAANRIAGTVVASGSTAAAAATGAGGRRPLTPALQRQAALAAKDAAAERQANGAGVSAAAAAGTLDAFIYGDNMVDSGINAFYGSDHIRFSSRVTAVGDGWIELERPLPYDLRTEWQPRVYQFYSTVQHSGIEHMTIRFPWDIYPEHLVTKGYNAITINSVSNCWAKWIRIINADNGVQVTQSDYVEVVQIQMSVTAPRGSAETKPDNGHHALWIGRSSEVVFAGFKLYDRYMHDLSVDGFCERTVFARGSGEDLNIDCHRAGPHSNLFSDIDLGKGDRAFHSGGADSRGAHAGANNTWWNVAPSDGSMVWLPTCDFGPLLNLVGNYGPPTERIKDAQPRGDYKLFPGWCPQTKWWVENMRPGAQLLPVDLYAAMVNTKQARLRR